MKSPAIPGFGGRGHGLEGGEGGAGNYEVTGHPEPRLRPRRATAPAPGSGAAPAA